MKEALKLALEALEQLDGIDTETECVTIDVGDVITAIKEALAPTSTQCEVQNELCPSQETVAVTQQVMGCFHAAEIEGLTAALANTTDEHLKDLVERRLMHALYAAQEVERNSK